MLIIRTSLSIEELHDTIANECIDRKDVDRDSFWKGAKFALEQLGIVFDCASHNAEEKDDEIDEVDPFYFSNGMHW